MAFAENLKPRQLGIGGEGDARSIEATLDAEALLP